MTSETTEAVMDNGIKLDLNDEYPLFYPTAEIHSKSEKKDIHRNWELQIFIDEDDDFVDELDEDGKIGESTTGWVTKAAYADSTDEPLDADKKVEIKERLAAYRSEGTPARMMVTEMITTYKQSHYTSRD